MTRASIVLTAILFLAGCMNKHTPRPPNVVQSTRLPRLTNEELIELQIKAVRGDNLAVFRLVTEIQTCYQYEKDMERR